MPDLMIFILESIGTQELVLIGIIALIVFGPRKLPQMAKKFGGMLTELRKVSSDFRTTWEREASIGDDLLNIDSPEKSQKIGPGTVPQESHSTSRSIEPEDHLAPAVKEVSPDAFESLGSETTEEASQIETTPDSSEDPPDTDSDKRSWL